MTQDLCPPKTAQDLEWPRILQALAQRCSSVGGRRAAEGLGFLESPEAVRRSLAEVEEAWKLEQLADPLPLASLGDIAPSFDRARIGSVLGPEELCSLRDALAAGRKLRRFLHSRREELPALYLACSADPTLDALEELLTEAFDADGSLSDRASPRLAEVRAERRHTRDRLVSRLEELARKHENILQDSYWTERDGRYVLPVRADAHERFAGIVHAASSSGATIFIEPRALVPSGNRLKMLDAEVTREELAVLGALTARVRDRIDELVALEALLTHADLRRAGARLCQDLRLTFPELLEGRGEAGELALELPGARHPLLALDGVQVVPSDLSLHFGKAIVVSGPNAGGKTVALKTLGLAALMLRAGLPVPAREGARVALVDGVLTDVGDDQSLTKNLSTFSAHVQNLARILDETAPRVLVLLDELAGGTDPREGEALAAAVLDSLCARGGAVACTTHYEGLKALALGDERFQNASVGFDLSTMTPTFRLALGVPGASSALAVARRFGIPGTVLDRAKRFLSDEAVSFESTVEKLAAERRALELAREAAEREAAASRQARVELDEERARLVARERTAITKEGEQLAQGIRRAREELRALQAKLRGGKLSEAEVKEATRALDRVAGRVALGGDLEIQAPDTTPRAPVQGSELRVGGKVFVPRLRAEAEIVEVLPGGQLRVALGPLKLLTKVSEVRASSTSEAGASARETREPARGRARSALDAAADPERPFSTSENTVDLRGLRADEAVSLAEQFLDRTLGGGRQVAFFIHGHGTGALREAVRGALKGHSQVARVRAAEPSDGGEGVTVAWLR